MKRVFTHSYPVKSDTAAQCSASGVSVIRRVYIIKCRKTDKTIEGRENEGVAQSKPQVYQPRPVFGFNSLIFTFLWHFLCGFSVVSTNIAWLG